MHTRSKHFLWIVASVSHVTAVDPNGIKTLLANNLGILPIKGNPVYINGIKNLTKNSPDCPILCNWDFDNFILAAELFP